MYALLNLLFELTTVIASVCLVHIGKAPGPLESSRDYKKKQSSSNMANYNIITYFEAKFISRISPDCIDEFLRNRSNEERNYTQQDLRKHFKIKGSSDNDKLGTDIFKKICDAKCEARKEIKSFKNLKFLHISSSMIPDITVYDNDNSPILFAEVESCRSFTSTIRKLCLELVAQLIYLRNVDARRTDVCGFAISLTKSEEDETSGGVVLVKMTWKPRIPSYIAEFQAVCINKFEEEVCSIYDIQKRWPLSGIDPAKFHCFPMGSDEISAFLSTEIRDEFIVHSTFSLIAITDDNVFKLSLNAPNDLNGFYAAFMNQSCLSQILLPTYVKPPFQCFSRLHGPANLDTCKNSLRSFSVSVYNAIDQLHQCGYAHLDVILPNICFKQKDGKDEWIAVLIDLDTVCRKHHFPMQGNKYLINYGMTGEQNDWRQYAVLVDCVRRKLILNEEYKPEFEGELQFLQSSYKKGEKPNLRKVRSLPGNEPITEELWKITS